MQLSCYLLPEVSFPDIARGIGAEGKGFDTKSQWMERSRDNRGSCIERSRSSSPFHSAKICSQWSHRYDQRESCDSAIERSTRAPKEILGEKILVPGIFCKHNWSQWIDHPAIWSKTRIERGSGRATGLWLLKSPLWGRHPSGWHTSQSHRLCRWLIYNQPETRDSSTTTCKDNRYLPPFKAWNSYFPAWFPVIKMVKWILSV